MSARSLANGFLIFLAMAASIQPVQAQLRRTATPEPSVSPIPLPRFYARHVEEGNKYLAQGLIQEAIQEFVTARTINSDYYPTYIGLGNAFKKMGQMDKAVDNYAIAINLLNPTYASEHVLRGKFFTDQRRYREALANYWEVLRIDPQAGNQYTLAMRHLRFDNEKDAIKAFEAAIEMDEDYPDPHYQLGNVYFRGDKLKKAIPAYEQAVSLDPNNPVYQFALGTSYYKQGTSKRKVDLPMVKKSRDAYERALQNGLQSSRLHYNLGTAYILTEQYDLAISHLQEARANLDDKDVYYNLGNAFFKRALTVDYVWDGYDNLTDPTRLRKNNEKMKYLLASVRAYEIALEKDASDAAIYYDLASSQYHLSELKLTPDFIDEVLKQSDEANQKLYTQKGVRHFKVDMLQKAVANLSTFRSQTSDSKASATAAKIISDLSAQIAELNR